MEVGLEGLREMVQELAAFLYTDDILVASPQPERLQRSFNVLTDLFNHGGLCANLQLMVSIAYWPYIIPGGLLKSVYTWRVIEIGPSYQERLWRRMEFMECRVGLTTGSLIPYLQGHHDVSQGDQGIFWYPSPPPGEAQNYLVSFPIS